MDGLHAGAVTYFDSHTLTVASHRDGDDRPGVQQRVRDDLAGEQDDRVDEVVQLPGDQFLPDMPTGLGGGLQAGWQREHLG